MSNLGKNDSFLDSKTLIAIAIVFSGILGWQAYLSKKYPALPPETESTAQTPTEEQKSSEEISEKDIKENNSTNTSVPKEERFISFQSKEFSFELSTKGMGIRNISINDFKERDGTKVFLSDDTNSYSNMTRLNKRDVDFDIKKISEDAFEGIGYADGIQIKKTLKIMPSDFLIQTTIETDKRPGVLETILSQKALEPKEGSFLAPSFEKEEAFVYHGESVERETVDNKKSEIFKERFSDVSIAALGKHYFTMAIVDQSNIIPSAFAKTDLSTETSTLSLQYELTSQNSKPSFQYLFFAGPKEVKLLSRIDKRLQKVIDFGYFDWFAMPILRLLKFLFSLVGNYGFAIILVTLLIRLILLPINVSSYRSMKKMQAIQPELKALKEKYKKDPKQLQIETMNFMKANKVNPLGGCLPMLLQLPVFFALYRVLAQSIELYQAPFIFWIKDLSLKDPYYVLPILMGITMYIQQKLTPSTMDPSQAKVMQFMPVIFSFLMVSLPSGLTLYIFVSTLFGIIQQYIVMNEKTTSMPVATKQS